ncbi:hypothetical protein B0H13DRAFT_2273000 [Mycena leptocephala]|nr:hypothetical protein B0H13DRAFT_2273000 [Mycena leptocephala]
MDTTSAPLVPYLHLFPMELWLACWTLCSSRQLRRLSLVCQLFRAICFPQLLQNQAVNMWKLQAGANEENWVDRLQELHRSAVRLDRLAKSSHVGSIRSWMFMGNNNSPGLAYLHVQNIHMFDVIYDRVLAKFSSTLGLYQNLRSLYLGSITIDEPFRTTLSSLSMLEDLTLRVCDVVAREGFLMEVHLFSFSGDLIRRGARSNTTLPLRIVSPKGLYKLDIDATPDSMSLITGFGAGKFPDLVDLSLHELFDVEVLLGFLNQCPRLEALTIRRDPGNMVVSLPKYLPRDIIPRLQRFTGLQELVGLFVLNRPVGAVTAFYESRDFIGGAPHTSVETLLLLLNDILRSSVPLLSLCLPSAPPSLDLIEAIASRFPEIKELSLTIFQPRSLLSMRVYANYGVPKVDLDIRSPELRDEDAFDNLPEDDLSDTEGYVPPPVVVVQHRADPEIITSTNLHTILNWIVCGRVLLPPTMEVLRFEVHEEEIPKEPRVISLDDQHRVIAALSEQCPLIRAVHIGYPSNFWRREGTLWKCSDKSSLQVVSN